MNFCQSLLGLGEEPSAESMIQYHAELGFVPVGFHPDTHILHYIYRVDSCRCLTLHVLEYIVLQSDRLSGLDHVYNC